MNKNTRKKTQSKKGGDDKKHKGDIKGIIYIFIGVVLAFSVYTDLAGALSSMSKNILYRFIGIGIYFLPLLLLYIGYKMIFLKEHHVHKRRIIAIGTLSLTIMFLVNTIRLQTLEFTGFAETLKYLMTDGSKTIHGGFIAQLITYPLTKLIGFPSSYVLYITVIVIGAILAFEITLADMFKYLKNNIKKEKQSSPKISEVSDIKPKTKSKKVDSMINVVSEEDPKKSDYIKGINNKIEILDFMKNSTIEDEPVKQVINDKVKSFNKSNVKDIEQNTGDIITKEIEAHLQTNNSDAPKQYNYPSLDLLHKNNNSRLRSEDKKDLIDNANKLEETLGNFGVEAKVMQVTKGPSVTRFELQPSPGVKVSKIVNLQDDIALGLAASGVRMEAPIPGKAAIGIEVPNKKQMPVFLREVLESKEFLETSKKLAFSLGKDIAGKCVVGDLNKMPHMLIAGATGSGKSVCINTLIISLLYKYTPEEVRLLMVDPKVVELSVYNGIPHLLIPVVTEPKKAAGALNWAVNEMNKRYNLFSESKVKNIDSYNKLFEKGEITEKLPYIVIIVDELADLMMACPNDVEDYICRLAQMARAAGMHLIIATQRPSVDVITGVIKANIPSRISFAVSSGIDSRTILDQHGAEKLLGRGDMLYYPIGENKPVRVQGAFISEEEVDEVVTFIKSTEEKIDYKEEILEHINSEATTENVSSESSDEMIDEAIKVVIEYQQASTSFLQRKLRIGFNRASRIMDELEERGIISERDGSKPRQVLIEKDSY